MNDATSLAITIGDEFDVFVSIWSASNTENQVQDQNQLCNAIKGNIYRFFPPCNFCFWIISSFFLSFPHFSLFLPLFQYDIHKHLHYFFELKNWCETTGFESDNMPKIKFHQCNRIYDLHTERCSYCLKLSTRCTLNKFCSVDSLHADVQNWKSEKSHSVTPFHRVSSNQIIPSSVF